MCEDPLKEFEHGSRYLKSVLSFIGVKCIKAIRMEGMDKDAALAEANRQKALTEAARIARKLFLL